MISKDINDLVRLNQLWGKIFPYLALYVRDLFGKDRGSVLEYGIFSGGISIELAKLSSGFKLAIGGLASEELTEHIKKWAADSVPAARIEIKGSFSDFEDTGFDLVVSRGFFFYLDHEEILSDVFRVLRPGGIALLGGGYGDGTPRELIDAIAAESKILNARLGRKWFSKEELSDVLKRNGLIDRSELIDAGGVWIKICKNM